jgi:hypothetical protein
VSRSVGARRWSKFNRFSEPALYPKQIVAQNALDLLETAFEPRIHRSRSRRGTEGRDRTIDWNRHGSREFSIVSNSLENIMEHLAAWVNGPEGA